MHSECAKRIQMNVEYFFFRCNCCTNSRFALFVCMLSAFHIGFGGASTKQHLKYLHVGIISRKIVLMEPTNDESEARAKKKRHEENQTDEAKKSMASTSMHLLEKYSMLI